MEWNNKMKIDKKEFEHIQIMEDKLNNEFKQIDNWDKYLEFKNKYKNYIFIDYFIFDPILNNEIDLEEYNIQEINIVI